MNKIYLVEFSIEVVAESPEAACKKAWCDLTYPDGGNIKPIGLVTLAETGEKTPVDLEQVYETQSNPAI